GEPLKLHRLEHEHRYAVLEMGAQSIGELAFLCNTIASPNWAIVTNVGAAHLEYFGSQERVAIAKSELVEALPSDGIAILNYDDSNVRNMSEKTQARVLYYGRGEGAEVCGSDIGGDMLQGRHFTLSYQGQQVHVQLLLPGEHRLSGEALTGVVDYLVAIGDEARYYVEGAIRSSMSADNIYYFDADVENGPELEAAKQAAVDLLKKEVKSGDLVLLKGSRGMH